MEDGNGDGEARRNGLRPRLEKKTAGKKDATSFGETISSLINGEVDIDDVHRILEQHIKQEEDVDYRGQKKGVVDRLYPVDSSQPPTPRERELEEHLRVIKANLDSAIKSGDQARAEAEKHRVIVSRLKEENNRLKTETETLRKSVGFAKSAKGAKRGLVEELNKKYGELVTKFKFLKNKYVTDIQRFKRYQAKKKNEIQRFTIDLAKIDKKVRLGEQAVEAAKEVKQEFFDLKKRLRDAVKALKEAQKEAQAITYLRASRDANYAELTVARERCAKLQKQVDAFKADLISFENETQENGKNVDEDDASSTHSGLVGEEKTDEDLN